MKRHNVSQNEIYFDYDECVCRGTRGFNSWLYNSDCEFHSVFACNYVWEMRWEFIGMYAFLAYIKGNEEIGGEVKMTSELLWFKAWFKYKSMNTVYERLDK